VYNYHDSRACGYKWFGILYRLDGFGKGTFGMVFGVAYVEWCDP
jgi:hypothetical protein